MDHFVMLQALISDYRKQCDQLKISSTDAVEREILDKVVLRARDAAQLLSDAKTQYVSSLKYFEAAKKLRSA